MIWPADRLPIDCNLFLGSECLVNGNKGFLKQRAK